MTARAGIRSRRTWNRLQGTWTRTIRTRTWTTKLSGLDYITAIDSSASSVWIFQWWRKWSLIDSEHSTDVQVIVTLQSLDIFCRQSKHCDVSWFWSWFCTGLSTATHAAATGTTPTAASSEHCSPNCAQAFEANPYAKLLLHELRLLPVQQRITYELAIVTYKVCNTSTSFLHAWRTTQCGLCYGNMAGWVGVCHTPVLCLNG